jgi:hypothetical protein
MTLKQIGRPSALLITVFVVVVLAAVPASGARPQVVDGVCSPGESCAFRNTNLTGPVADFNTCEPNWSCGVSNFANWDYYGWSGLIVDHSVGSIWNRVTASSYTIYSEHTFGGGYDLCTHSGYFRPSLSYFNDKLSSMWNSNYNYCG